MISNVTKQVWTFNPGDHIWVDFWHLQLQCEKKSVDREWAWHTKIFWHANLLSERKVGKIQNGYVTAYARYNKP